MRCLGAQCRYELFRRAVQLSRRDADGERMDVWLDLDRNLLPARIHFVDRKGMVLEQVIREARVELAAAQ